MDALPQRCSVNALNSVQMQDLSLCPAVSRQLDKHSELCLTFLSVLGRAFKLPLRGEAVWGFWLPQLLPFQLYFDVSYILHFSKI